MNEPTPLWLSIIGIIAALTALWMFLVALVNARRYGLRYMYIGAVRYALFFIGVVVFYTGFAFAFYASIAFLLLSTLIQIIYGQRQNQEIEERGLDRRKMLFFQDARVASSPDKRNG